LEGKKYFFGLMVYEISVPSGPAVRLYIMGQDPVEEEPFHFMADKR
jgi:hypothetical protein